jgi:hypothetical protein
VMAEADWIIDMGPEAGDAGGKVVAQGTPAQIARRKRESHTGRVLEPFLRERTRDQSVPRDSSATATQSAARAQPARGRPANGKPVASQSAKARPARRAQSGKDQPARRAQSANGKPVPSQSAKGQPMRRGQSARAGRSKVAARSAPTPRK